MHVFVSLLARSEYLGSNLSKIINSFSHIPPTIPSTQVKTQRAMNDYRKSEYPHYRDELTKLKHLGTITAQRLKDLKAHVPEAPFSCVETGTCYCPRSYTFRVVLKHLASLFLSPSAQRPGSVRGSEQAAREQGDCY
jgi:hypothetical protein